MNIIRALRVAELRKKVAVIPFKLILALILAGVFVYSRLDSQIAQSAGSAASLFDSGAGGFAEKIGLIMGDLWKAILAGPLEFGRDYLLSYGLISVFSAVIQTFKNRFIGLIVAAALAAALVLTKAFQFVFSFVAGRYNPDVINFVLMAVILLGPVIDFINIIRYNVLKKRLIREEEKNFRGYDDGFEEGYRRGMVASGLYREYSYAGEEGRKDEIGRKGESGRIGKNDRDDENGYEDESGYEDENGYDDENDYEVEEKRTSGRRLHVSRERHEPGVAMHKKSENLYEDEADDSGEASYNEADSDFSYQDIEKNNHKEYDRTSSQETAKEYNYVYGNSENVNGFFADCKDKASIKKRYHDLCKVYHPDSGNVCSDIFYRIKDEYEARIKESKY